MASQTIITLNDGIKVWASSEQAETLEVLMNTRAGGMASVHGYRPSTDYVTAPVQNIQFLSRFSTERLYQRKLEALKAITFDDVASIVADTPKLADLTIAKAREVFEARKAKEMESLEKSLAGDRDDAHRQGHDRCYARITSGIKVNYVTEKGDDGLMHPVLVNGFPVVASIMINALFLNVTTIVEGERKVVNSGAPVLMGKAISKVLNQRSVGFRTLSLKADNFEKVVIDHNAIIPENVKALQVA